VAGTLGNASANETWSEAVLNAAGRAAIHKAGRTQLRVSFGTGDNDDMGADFMGWYPGENTTTANRPQLVVVYQ